MSGILARPEQPITESIARISIEGERVRVFFPEKLAAFRAVIDRLGYRWNRPCFVREVANEATRFHRAAELVRDLLAAGFVVRADEALVKAAVAGDFTPEPRRWVKRGHIGEQEYFVLGWKRDEDCWHAAKRLPGARYYKPSVIVPAEQFEAVLDFAEKYAFTFKPGAQALVEEAQAARAAAWVVAVPASNEHPLPPPRVRPEKLEPAEFDIDPSLLDEEE